MQFLEALAKAKKVEVEEIKKKLEQCASPASNTKATVRSILVLKFDPKTQPKNTTQNSNHCFPVRRLPKLMESYLD